MNYTTVKNGLDSYDEVEVEIYINYLNQLENEKDKSGVKKNKWFHFFKDEEAINLFKKVKKTGLAIDGDMITIVNKGKIMAQFDFRAYRNLVLVRYPESIIDAQVVYNGDKFSFQKQSGIIKYNHTITDPFAKEREIIGAYCIIKNKRGEFLETLNMKEIEKLKNTAKTKDIWDKWFDRMVLKSVIKRTAKHLLEDIIIEADKMDNEMNDPELVEFPEDIKERINKAETEEELTDIYKLEKNAINDEVKFIELLGERKKEILGGKK